jgi:hypothetical protein
MKLTHNGPKAPGADRPRGYMPRTAVSPTKVVTPVRIAWQSAAGVGDFVLASLLGHVRPC